MSIPDSSAQSRRDAHVGRRSLAFGAGDFVDALADRLERSFARSGHEDALVAGIYGTWGSGKTTVLRALEERFDAVAEHAVTASDESAPAPLTLPVLFNAWRYEKEEHLIVPLLKTAEKVVLRWHEEHASRSEGAWSWLRDRGKLLSEAALALAYGFKGSFTFPLGPELEVDPGAALDEGRRRAEARAQAAGTTIDRLTSTYYDFHRAMRELTGRGDAPADNEPPRLNLLFLIDDLDRCLPEKAVQMLESIKLFLEVEGCAFVVAVDDEVVARGIAHRYRDYNVGPHEAFDSVAYSLKPERFREFQEMRGPMPEQPITGTEYLEKIIHLPFRIPPPTRESVQQFLCRRYSDLFATDEQASLRWTGSGKKYIPESQPAEGEREEYLLEREKEFKAEMGTREELLELFLQCVPPVPRKLIRAAELFSMLRDVAHARGMRDLHEPTLARLVFLQLFAPALFRFGRQQPAFLATLERWSKSPLWRTGDHMERDIQRRIEEAKEVEDEQEQSDRLYPLERLERPLLALVRDALHNRSGFDPRNLVETASSVDSRLRRYYHLVDATQQATVPTVASTPEASPPSSSLSDPEAFVSQLLSGDPLALRNALDQEADRLDGRVIDRDTFQTLIERISHRPAAVTVPWLEALEPHLTFEQLSELYRVSDLLPRLSAAATETSPS